MSVGYFSAHTARETQLLDYLVKLMEAFARIDVEGLVTERDIHAPKEYNMGGYYGYGGLVMPSKEARTAQGWSKQDEIKWKQDKKNKSTKSSTTKKQDDFISPAEELSKDDLKAILGGLDDDDFGPKAQKSNKYQPEDEFYDSEPNWEEFFEGLPE